MMAETLNQSGDRPPRRKRRRRRLLAWVIVAIACFAGAYAWWSYRGPTPPVQIFRGVTYSCERLPEEPDGGGLLYLVQVDLTAPGIGIYTTPLDPDAVAKGWEYKLKHSSSVVREQNLAVAINATLYESDSALGIRKPGDLARAIETMVSNHGVNHSYQYGWLLGLDDHLAPFVTDNRPPSAAELARARWGVESQLRILSRGKTMTWNNKQTDHRTVIGINPETRQLWLACFEKATYQYAARILAQHGATDAVMMDGGTSTTMAIGPGAVGIRPGDITGDWRPDATFFGIRAERLNDH